MGAGQFRAGADDDGAGVDFVLRRAGAQQERPRHHDAQPDSHGAGVGALDGVRLQPGVRAGQWICRKSAHVFHAAWRGRRAESGLRGHGAAAILHAVSNDVCHHHARAHQRRDGGTDQVQGLRAVRAALDHGRVFSAVPHGLGQGYYPFLRPIESLVTHWIAK